MKRKAGDKGTESRQVVRSSAKKTTIGGQALIEGLMMIGPAKKAMAIRKPDGTILLEEMPMTVFQGAANWPFIRGNIRLFRQMISGTKALLRSAEFVEEATPAASSMAEDGAADTEATADPAETAAEPGLQAAAASSPAKPREGWLDRFIGRHEVLFQYGSVIIGLLFGVGLFILLPNLITSFIKQISVISAIHGAGGIIVANLIEGLIRIVLFLLYLLLASRMKDIRRVWMYHGAEHKTIACYEARQELTVENIRLFSRFHPRCGTAFLFIVILVSVIIFSFAGWWGRWLNLLIRFALVPVVAGIAYEIIRIAGRHDSWLSRLVAAPGLWLQRLTTAEPDDSMLEVAIVAMEAVIPREPQSDNW